jgi:hypothetical protein
MGFPKTFPLGCPIGFPLVYTLGVVESLPSLTDQVTLDGCVLVRFRRGE